MPAVSQLTCPVYNDILTVKLGTLGSIKLVAKCLSSYSMNYSIVKHSLLIILSFGAQNDFIKELGLLLTYTIIIYTILLYFILYNLQFLIIIYNFYDY